MAQDGVVTRTITLQDGRQVTVSVLEEVANNPTLMAQVQQLEEEKVAQVERPRAPMERGEQLPLERFASELHTLNPKSWNRMIQQIFWHPIDTAKGILGAQGEQFTKFTDRLGEGDYLGAGAQFLNYAVPVLGPAADYQSQLIHEGDYARAAGAMTDLGLSAAIPGGTAGRMRDLRPSVQAQSRQVNIPGGRQHFPSLQQREAINAMEARGVPLDLATRGGQRPTMRVLQEAGEFNVSGGVVADRLRTQQQLRLGELADEYAGRAAPDSRQGGRSPRTEYEAGESLRGALGDRSRQYGDAAGVAYDEMRALQQQAIEQGHVAAVSVDLGRLRQQVEPIVVELERLMPPAQREMNAGLQGMRSILQGDQVITVSMLEENIGALKAMARRTDMGDYKNQRLISQAQQMMEGELNSALRRAKAAGFNLETPLLTGRAQRALQAEVDQTMRGMYDAKGAGKEGVSVYRSVTQNRDARIGILRRIAKEAPDELPRLGRVWLEELIERSTLRSGQLQNAPKLWEMGNKQWTAWNNLGNETKKLIFPDPGLRRDLRHFFQTQSEIAKRMNTSGTARAMNITNLARAFYAYPIAQLMLTRRGVRFMTRGLSIPASNKAAAGAWMAQYLRYATEGRTTALAPGVAETDQEAPQPLEQQEQGTR
jgi:hypothetical protein